ncbi:ATP-dependent DNA ligase [Curtobacterium sp. MCBD17_040]|uniref:ATP-dependent DNA ligase n=1 Tax=Curtobacterium sp. MCBD17_040 TaxID=2175674 RepID=UPI0021ACE7A8|nr:ATP-dependent DNA ligase [Curtobacterium sp. MCBD17_040]WIB65425.1 ATP-dependent DNA ligase [Curtobacterium sp. MCBD17_040]
MPPFEPALARAASRIPHQLPGGVRFEPKFDGWRLIAERCNGSTRLWSRRNTDLTAHLPDIADAVADQVPDGFTLDGEVVVWSDDGERLDFPALQRRLITSRRDITQTIRDHPAHYVVFDLLTVAGRDITAVPLRSRRELLTELAADWRPPLHLCPQTDNPDLAEEWFRDMPAAGIEGIVAKAANAPYQPGERTWVKVKHRDSVDVVCAAVTGTLTNPQELIVGLPIDGELRIVGRTAPLATAAARTLAAFLEEPGADHPWPEEVPATTIEQFGGGRGTIHLTRVKPLTIEVSADTAWSGRRFRHTLRYLRPRPELNPDDVELPDALRR